MPLDALIFELIEVIQLEVATFQRLLETLEREQQALIHHEVETLKAVVEVQERLMEEAAALEKARDRIVDRLSASLQEDRASLTLKRLVERVQGPHSERLREMRETLIALQEKIQKANRHNALLIKQSMKYVDKSMQILTGGSSCGGVYVQSGKVENPSPALQTMLNQVI